MSVHIHHVQPDRTVDDEAALVEFQKQWATYQKVVDHDSLSHREVGQILHDILMAAPNPFNFLDIACGDAGQMQSALRGTKVRHYRGIDLSEPALELAAKNLTDAPFGVDLDCCDFVAALAAPHDPVEISWCSLSIHHLTTEGKRGFLEAIRGSTRDFLMIYEPILLEDEDLEAYMVRFKRIFRARLNFLTKEEWEQIYEHVSTCDLPETATTWMALGRTAGFTRARQIYCDPTGFLGLFRYDC